MKRGQRWKLFLLALLVGGIVSVSAYATTTIYWGYNNLTQSNPPLGTCSGNGPGVACSGFNNWDRSQIQIAGGTGAIVSFGFQNCAGCVLYGASGKPLGTYTLIRNEYNSVHGGVINPYNRTMCGYGGDGSASYVQCRAIWF